MPLSPKQRIGAYEIVRSLGSGGMGEVYRARDTRLGRDVALKVLPEEVTNDPMRLERFDREARAIAALNHPHIVTIYSTENVDGVRFLTMELVEGCTLGDLVTSTGMPLARFLDIALPLADALAAAHQKQITHRDLKPGNVMVSDEGRVKVLDFGLARLGSDTNEQGDATASPITREGRMIGTMPYMSPEQVEGRPIDSRSDLFSLGVVFYELLTGRRPFKGRSKPALMSAILRDTPPGIGEQRPGVPEAIDRLVARLLEKRPEDRVQTARDVFNELRHIKSDPGAAAPRKTTTRDATRNITVAVQPFEARGADKRLPELAADLGEEIGQGLSRFGYLRVLSGATAAAKARYTLGGQVRKAGQSIRVNVKLVDADSGATLWADSYDGGAGDDVFAIEDSIASRVVATVGDETGVLMRSMAAAVADEPIEQLCVAELVLRYHTYNEDLRSEEHARLRAALEAALQREPRAAEGWACLAILCEHEHGFGYNRLPNTLQRQRWAAERAIALDPRSQHAWSAMTAVHLFARDLPGVRETVERSAALNPLNSDLIARGALLLSLAGDHDRALELTNEAVRTKPRHPASWHFVPFNAFYARGDDERALQVAKLLWIPAPPITHLATAAAAGQLGRTEEAKAAIAGLQQTFPIFVSAEAARQLWTTWIIDQPFIDRLVDGFQKALVLAADLTEDKTATKPPSSSSGSRTLRSALSVAVLPFVARSSDDESRALAEGLTDDITSALSRFGYIGVLSRSTVEQLTREHTQVRMQARYTIEGHVRRAGSTVRISLTLVDTHTGTNLWSTTYDRDVAAGTFALQDEISSAAVATIGDTSGVLVRAMAASLTDKPIEEMSVAELAVRFNVYVDNFRPDEHLRLRNSFERALEQEAPSAEGWACLSLLYEHEHAFGFNLQPGALERHRRAAQRAVEIDLHSQTAWVAMARAEVFARDLLALNVAVEHVVRINPLNADLMALAGFYLSLAGEYERGSAIVREAITRKPQYPGWYRLTLFNSHFARGDYEAALREIQLVGRTQMPLGPLAGAAASGVLGRTSESRIYLAALREIHPALQTPEGARSVWQMWFLDEAFIEAMLDGFKKALALG
jgi:TolB-like protein